MPRRSASRYAIWALVLALLTLPGLTAGQVAPAVQLQELACPMTTQVAQLTSQTSQADWAAWVARLSGEVEVTIAGEPTRILTRYSPAMFGGKPNAQAYAYVRQQILSWYPAEQVEEHAFTFDGQTWKNLIITLPGIERPEEVIILSAHLDSLSEDPLRLAPGASDNATGVAALLEAARVFRAARFERTLRLIFFTGEEQGKVGSTLYVREHDQTGVLGVINLDMFGYDADDDHCFELHAGTLPASRRLASCFQGAMAEFQPALSADVITGYDLTFSDHDPFWETGIGALLVVENISFNMPTNGCNGVRDRNPNYHRSTDSFDTLNLETGFAIAQSALAAGAAMAGPLEVNLAALDQPVVETLFRRR